MPIASSIDRAKQLLGELRDDGPPALSTRKGLAGVVREFEEALVENQRLQAALEAHRREHKHQRNYVDTLKQALAIRAEDLGFDPATEPNGVLALASLRDQLEAEQREHQVTRELTESLDARLRSCKQTLADLLRSSQAAAKKLKLSQERLSEYETHLAAWGEALGVQGELPAVSSAILGVSELRELATIVGAELGLTGRHSAKELKEAVLTQLLLLKDEARELRTQLDAARAENQDMSVVQSRLTLTVAQQEQSLSGTATEIGRLRSLVGEQEAQLSECRALICELQQRQGPSVAASTSASASGGSVPTELTGSVINTRLTKADANTMKLSDLSGGNAATAADVEALLTENANLRQDVRELERIIDDLKQALQNKDVSIALLTGSAENHRAQLDDLLSTNLALTAENQRLKSPRRASESGPEPEPEPELEPEQEQEPLPNDDEMQATVDRIMQAYRECGIDVGGLLGGLLE